MARLLITSRNRPEIDRQIDLAFQSGKDYEITISKFDGTLKGRQRALAQIWFKQIDEEEGNLPGYAEARCKLDWGLKIRCEGDPELEHIVRTMLARRDKETKIEIVKDYSDFFPVLRSKGGLNTEQQGRYLRAIQLGMSEGGIILTSPNEKELLNCKEANKE